MDLFVVNRYWGEKIEGPNGAEVPEQKMKRLLQRIEERKKLKERDIIRPGSDRKCESGGEREKDEEVLKSTRKKTKKRKYRESVIAGDLCGEGEVKFKCERDYGDEVEVKVKRERESHDEDEVKVKGEQESDEDVGSNASLSSERFRGTDNCESGVNNTHISSPLPGYSGEVSKNEEIHGALCEEEGSNKRTNDSGPPIENFTVIGTESHKSRVKASHKLPPWLANPVPVPVDLERCKDPISNYEGMLDQKLIKALRKNGVTHFFPVQAKVIPWLLESNLRCRYHWPRDLCVSAPTGSGKTLAFVLPIVQALMNRMVPEIRVLVVLPVVELAKQVGSVFRQYCAGTGLQVTVAVGGGKSFASEHSLLVNHGDLVGCQTDIFVTTPGRLVAHLRADSKPSHEKSLLSSASGKISLKQLQFLVIDEADRVAEGGQNDWLSHLVDHLERNGRLVTGVLPPSVSTFRNALHQQSRPPQKLLFSATLSHDPEKLSALSLFQPKLFMSISSKLEGKEGKHSVSTDAHLGYTTPKELSEEYVVANNGEAEKPLILLWILQQRMELYSDTPKVLIFTGTRKSSMRLALLLSLVTWDIPSKTMTSGHLSSDLSVQNREKVLHDFVKGWTNVLVCSDALARGVDIPSVDLVISYDPPRFAKNHIHRIGRTGRAGQPGCAITILTPNQVTPFATMLTGGPSLGERKKIDVPENSLSDLNEKYEIALVSMEKILEDEKQNVVAAKKKRRKKLGNHKD